MDARRLGCRARCTDRGVATPTLHRCQHWATRLRAGLPCVSARRRQPRSPLPQEDASGQKGCHNEGKTHDRQPSAPRPSRRNDAPHCMWRASPDAQHEPFGRRLGKKGRRSPPMAATSRPSTIVRGRRWRIRSQWDVARPTCGPQSIGGGRASPTPPIATGGAPAAQMELESVRPMASYSAGAPISTARTALLALRKNQRVSPPTRAQCPSIAECVARGHLRSVPLPGRVGKLPGVGSFHGRVQAAGSVNWRVARCGAGPSAPVGVVRRTCIHPSRRLVRAIPLDSSRFLPVAPPHCYAGRPSPTKRDDRDCPPKPSDGAPFRSLRGLSGPRHRSPGIALGPHDPSKHPNLGRLRLCGCRHQCPSVNGSGPQSTSPRS